MAEIALRRVPISLLCLIPIGREHVDDFPCSYLGGDSWILRLCRSRTRFTLEFDFGYFARFHLNECNLSHYRGVLSILGTSRV